METKSQAFHRLAGRRLEAIEDALRIFGNLAGPSYQWTPEEVLDHVARIRQATDAALERFRENPRRWPDQALEAPIAAAAELDQVTSSPAKGLVAEIRAARRDEPSALVDLVAQQRAVIENLQTELEEARRHAHV
jgi:hypothetical protein